MQLHCPKIVMADVGDVRRAPILILRQGGNDPGLWQVERLGLEGG